jgi:phosphoribosylaminoimidazolecarboxamide formyltransferase/IMP cyclohydrolase
LSRKAFAHTGAYDTAIAATFSGVKAPDGALVRLPPAGMPAILPLALTRIGDLRYGENPHQVAAWYASSKSGFGGARLLQGKELSYTNLLDLDAAMRIVLDFGEPAAAVIKHTNPCGAATGSSAADAYVRARDADALSAFGGVVGLNRPIDADTARAIVSTKIDAVAAPDATAEALPILATKAQMRVVVGDFTPGEDRFELRSILGGVLAQERDRVVEAADGWPTNGLTVPTRRQPTPEEWMALRFAWRVCAHVKSNAIIFTSSDRTLAIGAGQMSRVDAANVARMKAAAAGPDTLRGSVAASDAFIPFRDGLEAIADAGATAVVQPGGSLRDAEVIAAADERGLAMVFTGARHFRH